MNATLEPIPQTYEDILHEVFDQSSQGFQVINRDWRYVFVNKEVAAQGKSTQERLIGHTMMEMYPGIDKTPLFVQLRRVMDDHVSVRMENEFIYPDGTKGWFQLFIHPYTDGIIIFSVDITKRKQAEESLLQKITEIETKTPEVKKQVEELKRGLSKLYQQEPTLI